MPTFLKSATALDQFPPGKKPQVALVGRSNVGKSSLINSLANQKQLAYSSSTPGRTRLMNIYDFGQYHMIDLPGYGYAVGRKSSELEFDDMIGNFLEKNTLLRLVLVIIDARQGATDLDLAMIQFLQEEKLPFGIIVNKIDKLSKSELAALQKKLNATYTFMPQFYHSATKQLGRGEITAYINQNTKS